MKLTPTTEKFILHWGEMGSRWGVNRTVAQIHALLYLAEKSLNAEQISETLGVARSNVSTSLKELQSWGLVKVIHRMGDRRDYFESQKDVWDIFFVISEERKRRELDPTLTLLRECVLEGEADKKTSPVVKERIQETLLFLEQITGWYEQIRKLDPKTLSRLMKLGSKIKNLLSN
ncbi:GbsR/MarR family transcriptional regulator [Thiorhodovibrio frisius]|uniref:HTH-type transcriptional regulator n=1 Tax=Thiorhodovibrio frisius TaxID=631362 RepID=H8Z2E3_9GAMM|nr:MarR family transcriptional regulator [Thiorhodovibrio frisius]EIC21598.1 putative transcriptional regulator [Thiorhodovibrio frisius]WPL21565.1 MarR family protein [Thiorhodovibrio frisius]